MKRIFVLMGALLYLTVLVCSADEKDRRRPKFPLAGMWSAVAHDRSGLKRITIGRSGKSWTIQAWAYATFEEIDWGKVPLQWFGHDIASETFDSGLAVWKPDFAVKYMTLHIENDQLVAETFTVFTDGSKRTNYRVVERFVRSR